MDPFKNRRWVIILIIISVGIIFSFRLLYIQIINNEWSERAEKISLSSENIQPPRGFIYDRNNKLLVGAATLYDLYILPIAVRKKDTSLICDLFKISKNELEEILYNASHGYNVPYKASIFISSITQLEHAKISPFLGRYQQFLQNLKLIGVTLQLLHLIY